MKSLSRIVGVGVVLLPLLAGASLRAAPPGDPVKAVFHLNEDDPKEIAAGLRNIENILTETAGAAEIVVVAHGEAVKEFLRDSPAPMLAAVAKLQKTGRVTFDVCHNTLEHMGKKDSDACQDCRVVPSGALEVIRLQTKGYSYFKP